MAVNIIEPDVWDELSELEDPMNHCCVKKAPPLRMTIVAMSAMYFFMQIKSLRPSGDLFFTHLRRLANAVLSCSGFRQLADCCLTTGLVPSIPLGTLPLRHSAGIKPDFHKQQDVHCIPVCCVRNVYNATENRTA